MRRSHTGSTCAFPRSPKPDSTDAREWVRYATSDLLLAETVPPSGVLLEHPCFHAQQSAEKAIKAALIADGTIPPKTHSIAELVSLVEASGRAFPDDLRGTLELTPYSVVSRYPADFGELDETEWQEAVDPARRTVAWADGVVAAAGT